MALDPRIILSGRDVDVVGAMRQGNAAAAETNALRMQNDLSNLYRTQGAQIMAGDAGALNALAMRDPALAMDIQAKRQDFTYNQRRLEILNAEEKRAIAQEASRLSEAQKAAALQAAQQEVLRFVMAPDAATFDQMVTQAGKPELAGMYDQRERLGALYMDDFAKAMEMAVGPQAEPLGPQDRYKVVGGTLFDLAAEGGPAAVAQGAMPEETILGPDGKPIIVRGGPGTNARFTEAQSKDNVFATRARGALDKLEQPLDPNNPQSGVFADALAGFQDSNLNRLPLVGNYLTTDNFQVARTAGDEFLQAILRKDTGAAITTQEQELYGGTYLPQPGDGDARLAYKREARARAVAAIEAGMSQQQLEALARADAAVLSQIEGQGGAATAPAPQAAPAAPTGNVGGINWRIVE